MKKVLLLIILLTIFTQNAFCIESQSIQTNSSSEIRIDAIIYVFKLYSSETGADLPYFKPNQIASELSKIVKNGGKVTYETVYEVCQKVNRTQSMVYCVDILKQIIHQHNRLTEEDSSAGIMSEIKFNQLLASSSAKCLPYKGSVIRKKETTIDEFNIYCESKCKEYAIENICRLQNYQIMPTLWDNGYYCICNSTYNGAKKIYFSPTYDDYKKSLGIY